MLECCFSWDPMNRTLTTIDGTPAIQLAPRWPEFEFELSKVACLTIEEVAVGLKLVLEEFTKDPAFHAGDASLVVTYSPPHLFSHLPLYRAASPPNSAVTMDFYDHRDNELTVTFGIPIGAAEKGELLEQLAHIASMLGMLPTGQKDSFDASGDPVLELTYRPPATSTIEQVSSFCRMARSYALVGHSLSGSTIDQFHSIMATNGSVLLGQAESSTLEVKRSPYEIQTPTGRHKYALDLAAFANSPSGGVIVLGATTERDGLGRDIIAQLGGVAGALVNTQHYGSAARQFIYPPIEGLRFEVLHITASAVLLVVLVPSQPKPLQPFLVRGSVSDSGKLSGTAVTVPVRRGDGNWTMSTEELHVLLSHGLQSRVPTDDDEPKALSTSE
jgi:hypothetical protein